MELTGKLKEAFNTQVTMELKAAVVYRQLSIDMDALDLPGIAGWFKAQSAEEEVHADKFITHMLDRDATPLIGTIEAQGKHVTTVLEAFEAALAHEKKVSESIRNLYRLANSTDDIDALPLLNWFVDEQIEEESTVSEIIGRVKLIGEDGSGLLRLDSELGARPTESTGARRSLSGSLTPGSPEHTSRPGPFEDRAGLRLSGEHPGEPRARHRVARFLIRNRATRIDITWRVR